MTKTELTNRWFEMYEIYLKDQVEDYKDGLIEKIDFDGTLVSDEYTTAQLEVKIGEVIEKVIGSSFENANKLRFSVNFIDNENFHVDVYDIDEDN